MYSCFLGSRLVSTRLTCCSEHDDDDNYKQHMPSKAPADAGLACLTPSGVALISPRTMTLVPVGENFLRPPCLSARLWYTITCTMPILQCSVQIAARAQLQDLAVTNCPSMLRMSLCVRQQSHL